MSHRRPTVLLRHTLPDGSHHFDWLLARDADGPLLTFRLQTDISSDGGRFEGLLLPDHRRAYLEYEGPISRNRGHVIRVAQGACEVISESPDQIEIWAKLGVRRGFLRGSCRPGDWFLFEPVENC